MRKTEERKLTHAEFPVAHDTSSMTQDALHIDGAHQCIHMALICKLKGQKHSTT